MAGALTAAIAAAFAGGAAPPSTDDYFEYTTLLLPGNGTNGAQNNTFLDGSTNNFTITRNGNTTQGTFSPFSQTGWGNYLTTTSYLQTPSNANFAFGTGDYTVEGWFYSVTTTANLRLFHFSDDLDNVGINYTSTGTIAYYNGSTNTVSGTTPFTPNQWNHVAVVRSSGTVKIYVNGTSALTQGTTPNTTASRSLGITSTAAGSGSGMSGYMSNIRVVKGTAVYTSNFTPPTTPLTAISGTQLLTAQSNRFVDNSSNGATLTTGGGITVVSFSPFNPTASWSAATYGGSGYFDGNGDYLTYNASTSVNVGTGDFTIEGWFYTSSFSAAPCLADFRAAATNSPILIEVNTSGFLNVLTGSTRTSTVAMVLNQWNHWAVCRTSGTFELYVNGQRGLSVTDTFNFTSPNTTSKLGQNLSNTSNINGYVSGFRIIKGTALYNAATYTIPTAPPTAITNTSLLLNFTNAGIYDATSKNDLETVGNAQISTTQSKWGGSSMSFDGTGDWLLIPDQPPQRIGTGNFTVEMWVYRNSSGTYGLAGKGTGTTGWLVSLNSSNQVVFTYGSSTITSSGTVSATTWTHIAVVREGTSTNQTKIYISGTNDGTGTVSTDFNQTNSMYIGADRTGGSAANAYVQDVRITNYARYTSNFTAPTAAFPTL
jgi:Concanavalin A-like lectin/glucanases superfamily